MANCFTFLTYPEIPRAFHKTWIDRSPGDKWQTDGGAFLCHGMIHRPHDVAYEVDHMPVYLLIDLASLMTSCAPGSPFLPVRPLR